MPAEATAHQHVHPQRGKPLSPTISASSASTAAALLGEGQGQPLSGSNSQTVLPDTDAGRSSGSSTHAQPHHASTSVYQMRSQQGAPQLTGNAVSAPLPPSMMSQGGGSGSVAGKDDVEPAALPMPTTAALSSGGALLSKGLGLASTSDSKLMLQQSVDEGDGDDQDDNQEAAGAADSPGADDAMLAAAVAAAAAPAAQVGRSVEDMLVQAFLQVGRWGGWVACRWLVRWEGAPTATPESSYWYPIICQMPGAANW